MKVIGLTGGIASGKSMVSQLMRETFCLPIIDADVLAKEAVLPGSAGIKQIEAAFGKDMLLPDGQMDRLKMGERMRLDAQVRDQLNAIIHPIVEAGYQEALAAYEKRGECLVIYDCPLLFEAAQDTKVDEVLLVVTDLEIRIKRLMARDGIDEETARAKMAIQMTDAEKIHRADTILYNNGTEEQLKKAVFNYVQKKLQENEKKTCTSREKCL